MTILRLIGDVHGKYKQYLNLIKNVDYSIALGDIGFDYRPLKNVDHQYHRCLLGNHDNYDIAEQYPIFLANSGTVTIGGKSIFYIRGGRSVDRAYRIEHISWWREEELSFNQSNNAIELYKYAQPKFVISHECPTSILPYVLKKDSRWNVAPSSTANLLEQCYQLWQPDVWVFAHHHISWSQQIDKTRFICLDELETRDYQLNEQ